MSDDNAAAMYATGNGRYQRVLEEFRGSPQPPGASTHRTIVEQTRQLYRDYHRGQLSPFPGSNLAVFASRYKQSRQDDATRLYAGARVADNVDRFLLFPIAEAESAFPNVTTATNFAEDYERTLEENKQLVDATFERLMDAAALNAFAAAQRLQMLHRDTANPNKVRAFPAARREIVTNYLQRVAGGGGGVFVDEINVEEQKQRLLDQINRIYDATMSELRDRQAIAAELLSPDSFASMLDGIYGELASGLFDSLLMAATVAEMAAEREARLRITNPIEVSTLSGSGDDNDESDGDNPSKRQRLKCKMCGRVGAELFQCGGWCSEQPIYCSKRCQEKDWDEDHRRVCRK